MNILTKVYYKLKIDVLYNTACSAWDRHHWKPFLIMDAKQTVDYILEHRCSLARFGDGELQIAAYGCALNFQRADPKLQAHLKKVMNSSNTNLLLCLPNRLNMHSDAERAQLSEYWQSSLKQHLHAWTKCLKKSRVYGDTNLTRLTDGSDEESKKELVSHIQKIWNERNVIIVEGEKSRFGVGNALLDNARSVCRILGPAESAYDCFSVLLRETQKIADEMSDPLVLLALGPTATVLASELSDCGIQAIDLGHLDICYEHLITGKNGAVPGKYTNEAVGGNCVSDCMDKKYVDEIVFCVK